MGFFNKSNPYLNGQEDTPDNVYLEAVSEVITDILGSRECIQANPETYIVSGMVEGNCVQVRNVSNDSH